MRKTAAALAIALLVTAVAGLLLVDLAAAFIPGPVILPEITINSDGSISPQTDLISRNGSTYTLKANSQEYPIVIACSNIVFDGAGHTINITTGDNCGLLLDEVNNVIVRNVKVFSRNVYSIYLGYGSSNCLITGVQTGHTIRIVGNSNNITESSTGIAIFSGSNNLITRNNISQVLVGSSSNMFFKNNFYLTDYPSLVADNLWDNGSVGNYWSNYTIRYPNASEVGKTGIGDTPYIIERDWYSTKEYPDAKNVDNHPLMFPWGDWEFSVSLPQNRSYSGSVPLVFILDRSSSWFGYSIEGQENVTVSGNTTISGLAEGWHAVTVYANDTLGNAGTSATISFLVDTQAALFQTLLVGFAVVAVAVVAGAGLLLYRRKRQREAKQA